jgi:hypothetical protein
MALLLEPDDFRPASKVMRAEKFASEIFRYKSCVAYVATQKKMHATGPRSGSKQREINGFGVACDKARAKLGTAGHGRLRMKKL